jgi:hypothetical protein
MKDFQISSKENPKDVTMEQRQLNTNYISVPKNVFMVMDNSLGKYRHVPELSPICKATLMIKRSRLIGDTNKFSNDTSVIKF